MPTCPNCSHEFEVTFTPRGTLFKDFVELADSVLEHVRATRDSILSADDPRAREIGFVAVNDDRKLWRIPLTGIKNSVHAADASPRMQVYRTYLVTSTGRAKLAALWSQGVDATEPLPS